MLAMTRNATRLTRWSTWCCRAKFALGAFTAKGWDFVEETCGESGWHAQHSEHSDGGNATACEHLDNTSAGLAVSRKRRPRSPQLVWWQHVP